MTNSLMSANTGFYNKRIVLEYVDSLNYFPDTTRRIFNGVL